MLGGLGWSWMAAIPAATATRRLPVGSFVGLSVALSVGVGSLLSPMFVPAGREPTWSEVAGFLHGGDHGLAHGVFLHAVLVGSAGEDRDPLLAALVGSVAESVFATVVAGGTRADAGLVHAVEAGTILGAALALAGSASLSGASPWGDPGQLVVGLCGLAAGGVAGGLLAGPLSLGWGDAHVVQPCGALGALGAASVGVPFAGRGPRTVGVSTLLGVGLGLGVGAALVADRGFTPTQALTPTGAALLGAAAGAYLGVIVIGSDTLRGFFGASVAAGALAAVAVACAIMDVAASPAASGPASTGPAASGPALTGAAPEGRRAPAPARPPPPALSPWLEPQTASYGLAFSGGFL